MPPMPIELDVKERIAELVRANLTPVDIAINLCLYCMKTQVFNDGNKRASVIFANHFLIGKGEGLLVIPEKTVREFRSLLIAHYEGRDETEIRQFMRDV